MKKYIYLLFASLAVFSFQSCQEEFEPGGTAVKDMAGDWWVTVDVIDVDGTYYEDGYGIGHTELFTYNTAANLPTEMWLQDNLLHHFWDFKIKVKVNYEILEFSTPDFVDNQAYESKVKITSGKIIPGAATSPSRTRVDSIYCKIQFDDDGEEGSLIHVVSGFRKTGFPEDNF